MNKLSPDIKIELYEELDNRYDLSEADPGQKVWPTISNVVDQSPEIAGTRLRRTINYCLLMLFQQQKVDRLMVLDLQD